MSHFRLPGEAQVIDRIMEQVSQKYFADSPNGFMHQDAVYILAFAIIMLATVWFLLNMLISSGSVESQY